MLPPVQNFIVEMVLLQIFISVWSLVWFVTVSFSIGYDNVNCKHYIFNLFMLKCFELQRKL